MAGAADDGALGAADPAAVRGSKEDVERAFRDAFLSSIAELVCSCAFLSRLSTVLLSRRYWNNIAQTMTPVTNDR